MCIRDSCMIRVNPWSSVAWSHGSSWNPEPELRRSVFRSMTEELKPLPKKRREEALPERLLRRVFEGMGDVVDRKFGRTVQPKGGLTTSQLIERMKRLIDERVRDEGRKGRIAPHHLKLKVEWGTHSEAPPEILKELEHEVLAEAIDHINDHRYRTLAPIAVESEVDIF